MRIQGCGMTSYDRIFANEEHLREAGQASAIFLNNHTMGGGYKRYYNVPPMGFQMRSYCKVSIGALTK